MQALPGFRDFYPADCAARNYLFDRWRETARRYGFVEVDGPTLEPIDLYRKKSGGELLGQLFDFTDKGERHVALRPEMTPTLARMVAARDREFKKPLKWFSIASFFRYEKQQKGRLREFTQLNCDLIGETSPAADAEMIALVIDLMRACGLTKEDFVVRLSSRKIWESFLQEKRMQVGYASQELDSLLAIMDKEGKQSEEAIDRQLQPLRLTLAEIKNWREDWQSRILDPESIDGGNTPRAQFHEFLHKHISPRGLMDYIEVDFSIVRGLVYYTGIVFEVFDREKKSRALAGGGRYDELIGLLSDGAVKHPALGFAVGDVTLLDLLRALPHTAARLDAAVKTAASPEVFVVIADEAFRPQALALLGQLRDAGRRVDFALGPQKMGKQLQTAEALGAARAVIVGAEWPQVKLKTLATREETILPAADLPAHLAECYPSEPGSGKIT